MARYDVEIGDHCYIGYGDDYDWDGYKVGLAHELAATLLAGVALCGRESFAVPVARLVAQVVTWSKQSLPLKRIGSGLERLLMAVVDDRVPTDLTHSTFPGALEVDGVLEPVGRWIERFLCSAAIIARSAFRRKSDPRVTPLALEDCMEILEVGERQSPRLLVGRNYCGDGEVISLR